MSFFQSPHCIPENSGGAYPLCSPCEDGVLSSDSKPSSLLVWCVIPAPVKQHSPPFFLSDCLLVFFPTFSNKTCFPFWCAPLKRKPGGCTFPLKDNTPPKPPAPFLFRRSWHRAIPVGVFFFLLFPSFSFFLLLPFPFFFGFFFFFFFFFFPSSFFFLCDECFFFLLQILVDGPYSHYAFFPPNEWLHPAPPRLPCHRSPFRSERVSMIGEDRLFIRSASQMSSTGWGSP